MSSNPSVNFVTKMLPASRENPLNAYQNPSYHNRTIIPSISISSNNNQSSIQTTYLVQSSIQFSVGRVEHKSDDLSPVPSIRQSLSPVNHKRRAPDPDVMSESLASLRISDQSINRSPIRKTKRVHRCVDHQTTTTCKSDVTSFTSSAERSAFIYPLPVPLNFTSIKQSNNQPVEKVSESSNNDDRVDDDDVIHEDEDDLEDDGELLHDMHSFVIDESMKPCMPYIL